jgi:uncharacterized protein DUF6314
VTVPVVDPRSLLGDWRLDRRVVDRRAGLFGTVHGTLSLVEDGALISWREHGTLHWNGADHPITRELLVVEEADGWQVRFADGRAFHPWRPGEVVEHPCNADRYRGLVDVRPDRLRILWDVVGPAKEQRLFTRCRRSAE